MGLLVDIKSRNAGEGKIEMKKSKITKEEWNKRNLTDILNEHDIGDLMDYLVEFRLPELDPNYAAKKEDSGEPV